MRASLSTGISMHFAVSGEGEPVLLIPGTSLDHRALDLQREAYAKEFKVIAIDPRGAGRTDAPTWERDYSTEIMADDVAALIDALDLGAAHIFGLSLGSAIAQQLAIRHPPKVLSLQLHGTWARSDEWFQQAFVDPMLFFLKCGEFHRLFKFGQALVMSPEYVTSRSPARVERIVTNCLVKSPYPAPAHGFGGQLHADGAHDAEALLPNIKVPTLVTVGTLDSNTPERYGRHVANLIPGARFHVFEGPRASHCACWEMPDEFNKVTLDFLRSVKKRR